MIGYRTFKSIDSIDVCDVINKTGYNRNEKRVKKRVFDSEKATFLC
jgi:hypothetical protein